MEASAPRGETAGGGVAIYTGIHADKLFFLSRKSKGCCAVFALRGERARQSTGTERSKTCKYLAYIALWRDASLAIASTTVGNPWRAVASRKDRQSGAIQARARHFTLKQASPHRRSRRAISMLLRRTILIHAGAEKSEPYNCSSTCPIISLFRNHHAPPPPTRARHGHES